MCYLWHFKKFMLSMTERKLMTRRLHSPSFLGTAIAVQMLLFNDENEFPPHGKHGLDVARNFITQRSESVCYLWQMTMKFKMPHTSAFWNIYWLLNHFHIRIWIFLSEDCQSSIEKEEINVTGPPKSIFGNDKTCHR